MGERSVALPLEPSFEVTHDTLGRGRVKLIQPVRGFRSSLDPVLLCGFVDPPLGRFLDIGCGTGAVSFLLLAKDDHAIGTAVELQPRLAGLARQAATENGFLERLRLIEGDVRRLDLGGAIYDTVVSNPPFQPLGQGDLPPDRERSIAHHEVALRLSDWLDVADRSLRPGGRLAAVFPAARLPELLEGLTARRLAACRIRAVHPRPDDKATRILVEARRSAGAGPSLCVEPPLFVHEGQGYSAEVRRFLGEA